MPSLRDVLDLRAGLIGASLMAVIVAWINVDHGILPAATAASKQWAYTFFMGGLIVRLCTRLAQQPGAGWLWLAIAVAIPTAVTVVATFGVHSLRGTPRPLASTVPVALISPPSFALWARHVRRGVGAVAPGRDTLVPPRGT